MPTKSIEKVLREHSDSLMALPGVLGTAEGRCRGKPCITVMVERKTTDLEKKIPSELEGYQVEIVETGSFRALDDR